MVVKEEIEAKKTILYDEHIKLGAKMVPFGGWLMPVQYEGIIKEHNASRNSAGLFDVSHMGEIFIKGIDATDFLNSITPADISALKPASAVYTQLPNETGGVVDDLIIYNSRGIIENIDYLIVINASRIKEDVEFMQNKAKKFDVEVINKSDDFAMVALQGPKAKYVIEKIGVNLDLQPSFFTFKNAKLNDIPCLLTRTGYTGEDGFEIILDNKNAKKLWTDILSYKDEFNIHPAGLGARDTLRLEAGLPLYGHELNENTTPIESSLGNFVPENKTAQYSAKDFILGQKTGKIPLRRKLLPFIMQDRQIAREGYEVYIEGKLCGKVTSGAPSITLGKNIGFCMIEFSSLEDNLVSILNNSKENIGMDIQIMVRNKLYNAKITKKPFVKKNYEK